MPQYTGGPGGARRLPSSRGATGLGSRLSGMGLGSTAPPWKNIRDPRLPAPKPRPKPRPRPRGKALGGGIHSLMMQGGGGLSRGQQDMLRQAQELSATSGQNPAQLQALTAQHGNLYGQGQQRRARRQMAGNQPGRSAMRGIGPGMAYGGVPRMQGGGPPPMGSPPNRLDALRGAGPGGPGGPPPMGPPPGGPGGPPPMAGGPPPMGPPPGGPPIEEEGGPEGLSFAIADTLISNTSGVDEALAVLDEARDEVLALAGEEEGMMMEDEGMMMEDEGMGALEAMLGGGGPGPEEMLG